MSHARRKLLSMRLEMDDYTTKYGEVCDIVERNYHEWPLEHDDDNPFMHTSKEARAAALRIFEILGIELDN